MHWYPGFFLNCIPGNLRRTCNNPDFEFIFCTFAGIMSSRFLTGILSEF